MRPSQSGPTPGHCTRAGRPRLRARMAVWLLEEPPRVTMPRSSFLSSRTVWLGVRSSAAAIKGSACAASAGRSPARAASSSWAMSSTSALRSRMYSSSMAANWAASSRAEARTAQAQLSPARTRSRIGPVKHSSSSIMAWMLNTCATSSPASAAVCSYSAFCCSAALRSACSSRASSCSGVPAGASACCPAGRRKRSRAAATPPCTLLPEHFSIMVFRLSLWRAAAGHFPVFSSATPISPATRRANSSIMASPFSALARVASP